MVTVPPAVWPGLTLDACRPDGITEFIHAMRQRFVR
jgi:hypothetical protein